jgi:hypothetical protein
MRAMEVAAGVAAAASVASGAVAAAVVGAVIAQYPFRAELAGYREGSEP